MELIKQWSGLVALVILAISAVFVHQAPAKPDLGGVTNYDNVQLTNTGTSTLTRVGCIQGYATSTATPIVFTFNTQATTSIISALGALANGVVLWNYGQCGTAPGL